MLTRLRSTWLAGGGALLLALSVSGFVAGATLVADTDLPAGPVEPAEETLDTTLTFEDVDGDGIDDDCDDVVVADQIAADAAAAAVDTNADGVVSVPEAAHSDRVGGPNCNHGGYVSLIAHTSGDACDDPDAAEDAAQDAEDGTADQDGGAGADEDADADLDEEDAAEDADETDPDADSDELDEGETPADESADACAEETEEAEEDADDADETAPEPAVCETPVDEPAPEEDTPVDTAPNAHGKAVSEVAKSDAIGGKNCNHGGAVSEAAKKDHGAKQAHLNGKSAEKGHGKGRNKP